MKTANDLIVPLTQRIDTWHVTEECRAIAEPIATQLEITTEELLVGLSQGRIKTGGESADTETAPSGFTVTLPDDPKLRKRIMRAAAIDEQSIEQLVWRALVSDIQCTEESMIFDSEGSVIGDALPLEEFRTFVMTDTGEAISPGFRL